MEVVRKTLDTKLKGNDINLVDKILSYVHPVVTMKWSVVYSFFHNCFFGLLI